MFKTVVLLSIVLESVIHYFRIFWWIESSKEHLLEIKIFSSIMNVFTVTIGQFNVSLLNSYI